MKRTAAPLWISLACISTASDALAQERARIDIPAASFVRAENVAAGAKACGNGAYGAGVILNVPPCTSVRNAVQYEFKVDQPGRYRLDAEYAAGESRPVRVAVNGVQLRALGMRGTTGCWEESCQKWRLLARRVELRAGLNTLHIERDGYFPHIRAFRFRARFSSDEADPD